jgi:prophage antirepressor-like protein
VKGERGEPWFKASHVCQILGYLNTSKAIRDHVEEGDITKRSIVTKSNGYDQYTSTLFVNESGMYALIFGSKKPEARRFKHWLAPSVRYFRSSTKSPPKMATSCMLRIQVLGSNRGSARRTLHK